MSLDFTVLSLKLLQLKFLLYKCLQVEFRSKRDLLRVAILISH